MIKPMVLIHEILDPLLNSFTDSLENIRKDMSYPFLPLRGSFLLSCVDMVSYNAYSLP